MGVHVDHSNFQYSCADGVVAWEMARKGLGILPMLVDFGHDDPTMTPILPDTLTFRFPIWLTTHRELHTSRKIRLVFDALAEFIGRGKGD